MNQEVKKYLEKADKSLKVAEYLFRKGYWDEACSRAYYVMFYSAQALLRENKIDVTKHSAVVAKFGQYFAKTGKISSKYHRHFIEAKKRRETANYDVFSSTDETTAKKRIFWAEKFLREILRILEGTEE